MTQATRLPFGTALALAQRVLAAPLAAVLNAEGMAMPVWFTLNALGLQGPSPVEALSGLLATNGLSDPAVRSLLGELADAELVDEREGVVSLTASGAARYTQMRDRIETVTIRIFEQFDATSVETTRSLLQEIAQTDPDQLTRRSVRTG
jgi:DNA-binding MarR family transcriptional regulator